VDGPELKFLVFCPSQYRPNERSETSNEEHSNDINKQMADNLNRIERGCFWLIGLIYWLMQRVSAASSSSASLIYDLPTILARLDLDVLFPKAQPLEVELGSGDGSFLAEYAARNPQHSFIGVERLWGRIRKLDRKARKAGLINMRAVQIESSYFLRHLLPSHSATALHIYFPDPWPKRKHRRHRLVSEDFPALAGEALTEHGTVYLRTDDADYFQQMKNVFGASPIFEVVETPEHLASVITDFERDFLARGVQTLRAAYAAV
jgi:tRNA (guanine-N7-)-methyltransferase